MVTIAEVDGLRARIATRDTEIERLREVVRETRSVAASAIGALQRWESWAMRLQNSIQSPSPVDSSQKVADRFRSLKNESPAPEEET